MRFLPLVWGSLLRRKVRTTFTVGSIFIAFLLYAFLMTIRTAFSMGVDVAGADRLIMMHKVSLLQPLPVSYEAVIQATPGVKVAAHTTLFGGMYQNRANQFAVIAVDPEPYLEVFSEYHIPSPQVKAWLADRQGALVGRDLATRYGWKLGDRAPLQATIYPPKDGTAWFFNIDAIYDGDKAVDKAEFYFHYDYLNENRRSDYGQVGWYFIKIDDPSRASELSARLDAQFANSAAETKTSSQKMALQGLAHQIGDVGTIMIAILVAVLFSILLVTANTMAQSVRERTSELAVLKALGFSSGLIVTLVLAESLLMATVGGGLGLALAFALVTHGSFNNPFLPVFVLTSRHLIGGAALCGLIGGLAGALPAATAMRLHITDALRSA